MTKTTQLVFAMTMTITMTGATLASAQPALEAVPGLAAMPSPTPVVSPVELHAKLSPFPAVPVLRLQAKAGTGGQAKDDLFSGAEKFAQGASDVTEINLDPTTMGMVGKDKGKDGEMARKMKKMTIYTYKYDKPGMYRQEDVDIYRKKLEDGSWSCSIHVRNKTGSTDICSRTASDHETNEMVILTAEPQKLTFIHMSGQMSLDELDDMSGSANGLSRRVSPEGTKIYKGPEPPRAPAAPTPPSQ